MVTRDKIASRVDEVARSFGCGDGKPAFPRPPIILSFDNDESPYSSPEEHQQMLAWPEWDRCNSPPGTRIEWHVKLVYI